MKTRSGNVYLSGDPLDRVQDVQVILRGTSHDLDIVRGWVPNDYVTWAEYQCEILLEPRPVLMNLILKFNTKFVETSSTTLEFKPTELVGMIVQYIDPSRQDALIKHLGMCLKDVFCPSVEFLYSHIQKIIGPEHYRLFSQGLDPTVFDKLIEKACNDILVCHHSYIPY